MRVLNVMMGNSIGGLENAAIQAHYALLAAGCEVVTVLNGCGKVSAIFPENLTSIVINSYFARDPLAALKLRWKTRNMRFDVVLAHGNRAVRLAQSLKERAPIILDCHTTNYSARKVIDKVDGMIALTHHYRAILEEAGVPREQICVVPNPIRIGGEPPPLTSRSRPIIGCLGRLVPNKGFDILLEALAALKSENIDFQCVIHGVQENGTTTSFIALRDKLGLTENDVAFPGWTTDVETFLRSVDIFCMPSRREVLSLALLEALASGRPIICTRIPGLEDVFDDGKEGLFVDIENIMDLKAALKTLLLNQALRQKMGIAARERSRRFDIDNVGAQLRQSLEYFYNKSVFQHKI